MTAQNISLRCMHFVFYFRSYVTIMQFINQIIIIMNNYYYIHTMLSNWSQIPCNQRNWLPQMNITTSNK